MISQINHILSEDVIKLKTIMIPKKIADFESKVEWRCKVTTRAYLTDAPIVDYKDPLFRRKKEWIQEIFFKI